MKRLANRVLDLLAGVIVLAFFPLVLVFDQAICARLGLRATWADSARLAWAQWRAEFWK